MHRRVRTDLLAWINGTLYCELHGREDGRTLTFVFLQMAILALLAVFTAGAAGANGSAFAVVYAAFQLVLIWLWNSRLLPGCSRFPTKCSAAKPRCSFASV